MRKKNLIYDKLINSNSEFSFSNDKNLVLEKLIKIIKGNPAFHAFQMQEGKSLFKVIIIRPPSSLNI